ncbi:hypothetical protein CORC01_05365 [Colletotrichum orchidophilum]|uniref:Secreted protein n=1 Tax=Colletotrichum orchidophilum TaxID=1209926 RepID=A0A1G4BD52_9PEZI|nr:uncharacterized protein CORC01_05365 [Colletotrichum orchidophilum]OHE99324.1 hypothetical protein CORC01_05365 [Colletotrichum orchidophilum]
MLFTRLFFSVLASASLALAVCYPSGKQSMYDKDPGILDIEKVCKGLAGSYYRHQARRACIVDENRVTWGFELKFIGLDMNRDIAAKECMNGMDKEATCAYGGIHSYWNWRYKATPNVGTDCYPAPYWKPLHAYDPQDNPDVLRCRQAKGGVLKCWDDKQSIPAQY